MRIPTENKLLPLSAPAMSYDNIMLRDWEWKSCHMTTYDNHEVFFCTFTRSLISNIGRKHKKFRCYSGRTTLVQIFVFLMWKLILSLSLSRPPSDFSLEHQKQSKSRIKISRDYKAHFMNAVWSRAQQPFDTTKYPGFRQRGRDRSYSNTISVTCLPGCSREREAYVGLLFSMW